MKTLVVAPHPDDEVLGCGGLLLRRKDEGACLGWLILTRNSEEMNWDAQKIERRNIEILQVKEALGVQQLFKLDYPSAQLDSIPMHDLVEKCGRVFDEFAPDEVLMPHWGDVHSDHRIAFDALTACTKWFRYPSIMRVLAYETLSETNVGLRPGDRFCPNYFADIDLYLEQKIDLAATYQSEMGQFPFPRSREAIKALAHLRGAQSGFNAAEGYELLLERV